MILIKEKSVQFQYNFPKNESKLTENLTLRVKSLITNEVRELLISDFTTLAHYYTITLSLNDFEDGEYEYELFNDDSGICEKGLMIIGECKQERKVKNSEYNKEVIYTQYNG